MSDKKTKNIEEYDLEEAMKRLDAVLDSLSRDSIKLDAALELYGEGVALVKHCTQKLEAAERKISVLRTDADGEIKEEPFAAEGEQ